MEPSESKIPLFTANGTDPSEERSEPFKRAGCTALTALVVLLLVICVIYFITGIAAMGLSFWQTMR
ncbi:MAG: hypothetical protein WBW04_02080 [Nitrolancea sp.]